MKKRFVIVFFIALTSVATLLVSCAFKKNQYTLRSPNGRLGVVFFLDGTGRPFYRLKKGDSVVISDSRLGLIRDDGDFSEGLSLFSVTWIEPIEIRYEAFQGKRQVCQYRANRRIFLFRNRDGRPLTIVFQVSDDGVAFRYVFPDSEKVT